MLVAGGGVAAGALALAPPEHPLTTTQVDLRGKAVAFDDDQPTPEDLRAMKIAPATELRFQAPSVGLDVPISVFTAGSDVVPPNFTEVFQARNVGASLTRPETGTVFLFAHSIRGGGVAPGNYLIDPAHHTSTLHPGDPLIVGASRYTVESSHTWKKSDIADDTATWADAPGRLVFVTCLQKPDNTPSTENLIITARLTR